MGGPTGSGVAGGISSSPVTEGKVTRLQARDNVKRSVITRKFFPVFIADSFGLI